MTLFEKSIIKSMRRESFIKFDSEVIKGNQFKVVLEPKISFKPKCNTLPSTPLEVLTLRVDTRSF